MTLRVCRRPLVVFALCASLVGCVHRPDYVARFAHREAVPKSADYIDVPSTRPSGVDDRYRGLCRDHGFVSGDTNDLAATRRAIDAHNERYHRGERRADVLHTMITP